MHAGESVSKWQNLKRKLSRLERWKGTQRRQTAFPASTTPAPFKTQNLLISSPSRCLGLVFTATAHPVSPDSEYSIGNYVLQDAHIASTTSDYPLVV